MEAVWTEPSKTIYVAPRHPQLGRDAFRERWRQHGTLAMSLPIWEHACRYMQCDTTPGLDVSLGLPPSSDEHWGLGLVWLRNVDALRAMTTQPVFKVLYDDEIEAFGGQVEHFMLLANEAVLWDDGRTAVKLSSFFERTSGSSRDDVWQTIESWAGDLETPSANAPGVPCKLVLNRPLDVVYAGRVAGEEGATVRSSGELSTPIDSSLTRYDGMLELGFASMRDAELYLAQQPGGPLPAAWWNTVDRSSALVLATNEVALYDEP